MFIRTLATFHLTTVVPPAWIIEEEERRRKERRKRENADKHPPMRLPVREDHPGHEPKADTDADKERERVIIIDI